MTPAPQEQCTYCGEFYPKPIAYHHSTDECRANEAKRGDATHCEGAENWRNLVLRLRDSDSVGRASPLAEAADMIERLVGHVADLEEALADKRRLTRELDVAMHGEEGAAKQASLCDLIPLAKRLREQAAPLSETERPLLPGLKAALEIAERYVNVDGVHFLRNDIKDAILKAQAAPSAIEPTPTAKVEALINDINSGRYGRPLVAALQTCLELALKLEAAHDSAI